MATTNDITGARIITKPANKKYAEGWERIFGKDKQKVRVSKLKPAGDSKRVK